MLIASASRTAAVAHSAFPALSAPTMPMSMSSCLARSSTRLVIRQRRHSSSKHSSRAKQQQQPPVASGAEEQGAAGEGATQPSTTTQAGGKRARAVKKNSSTQQQGKEKEKEKQTAETTQGQQAPKAEANVGDVQATADGVAMLPSVPAMAHVDHKVVYLAKLFAQHRPISLSQPLPPQDGKAAFDSLFAPASARKKAQDVMFTLASAVKSLESAASSATPTNTGIGGVKVVGNASPFDPAPATATATINLEELAKTFRPFNTPPPPVPLDPRYLDPRYQPAEKSTPAKRPRKAIAVPTATTIEQPTPAVEIEEAPEAGSDVTIAPTFRGRMRLRHGEWLATWLRRMRDAAMRLISVKRQRKIKMKKHKKKKLMKRTRNLRRRLDRL